jgi:hypothetical protein
MSRLRRPIRRQEGIALIVVAVTVAVLGAVGADFAYNARVDLEAAANGRDQLRAEYLARSGISLARLLIKVQQSVLDKNRQFIGDVQIADFAPYLMKAFGGDTDEREGLGALLGIDASQIKGLGVGRNATFDVTIGSEDGKLNINCGGGLNDAPRQQLLYAVLSAMLWPPRYNPIFEAPDVDGQYASRDDVARAIIDWADLDETRFEPAAPTPGSSSGSAGSEDYRYDAGKDPYKAHNHFYDTVEEVNLVRGVGDEFWGSFGEMLTTYGGCKVNLGAIKPEHWPLMAAIIRATVKDDQKTNPALLDDVLLAGLAQQMMGLAQLTGGFASVNNFIDTITNPQKALEAMAAGSQATGMQPPPAASSAASSLIGVPLDPAKVNNVITIGPRRIYRLDSTGTIQRTKEKKISVHIRAIWDSIHYNQNTTSADPNDRQGTWVYWREE